MQWAIVFLLAALAYAYYSYLQIDSDLHIARIQLRDVEGCYKIACEERDLYCELLATSDIDEVEAEEMEVNALLGSDQEGAYVE